MNSFKDKAWHSDRRVPSLSAVRFLIADQEDARLPLKNLPDGVVAQIPHFGDFGDCVMPYGKVRNGLFFRVRIALELV